jgi:uncharacterized protein (DUF1330 family)
MAGGWLVDFQGGILSSDDGFGVLELDALRKSIVARVVHRQRMSRDIVRPSTVLRRAFERGNDMNKGYWVVAYRKVHDQATVKNYAALLVPALGKFGGRMLVSPTSVVTAQEAGFEQMTIVVEFDSYEIALAAYESDDHKKALAALGPGVERDFRIAEGV